MRVDYYATIPKRYADNPKLVERWSTLGETARARIGQMQHVVCTKCDADWTQHNSGLCQGCRTIECRTCGRRTTVKKLGLIDRCGTCVKRRRETVQDLDSGALA